MGVMHCDLKLDNILVNYDEATLKITEICISDFGLSSRRKRLRAGKDTRGTLPYMAPEMFLEDSTFDKKSDSWALGVILHALVT